MTQHKTNCSNCSKPCPDTATFCPHCGREASAPPPVNSRFIRAFTPTAEIAIGREFIRSRARKLVGASIGAATVGAVVAGLMVGSWLTENSPPRRGVAASAPALAAATAPQRATRTPLLLVRDVTGGFDIVVGDEVMHSIRTADDSRYANMAERKRAVTVRLDHVTEKTDGRFEARPAGEHYEVVWSDGAASFRLFDVTPADAKSLGTEHVDIAANLAADRMNAATKRPVAPVSTDRRTPSSQLPS